MKTLIFFRTHFISEAVMSEYQKICRSLDENEDLILFIDNNTNFLGISKDDNPIQNLNIENKTIKSFVYNDSILRKINLPVNIAECNENANNIMWYCSDYPFYMVRKFFPEYEYYWSIEYDVFCNGDSYRKFFDKYKMNSDLLISCYRNLDNEPDWYWQKNTEWIYQNVSKFGSFFPVVRLSGNAIDFLYNQRLKQEEIYKKISDKSNVNWAFCEIFVPTELSNNGFSITNINTENLRFAPVYNLNTERIFEKPDFKLYHPVK